jgi:hypothetical protein
MNTPGTRAWIGVMVVGFLGLRSVAEAKVVYVAKTGSDANDGLSWSTSKVTVQAGLNAAVAGDEVWVAAGTYIERITLSAEAALYGGFAGSETDRVQRDWKANKTILDGSGGGSVVTCPYGATPATRIDGFTIRNGKAENGGGIRCGDYSSPTITNNTITGNSAPEGGGIYGDNGSPTIINTIVAFNSSGIYLWPGSGWAAPVVRYNCVYGNAAYNYSGKLTDLTGTDGNISVDPAFVRAPSAGTDGKWATADDDPGDLHLKAGSPCIDAGDNGAVPVGILTDLDGLFRFFNDPATPDTGLGTAPIVDMGAYEYIPGDFDRDGDIDAGDLNVLVACVSGPTIPYAGDCAGADLDQDGDVDQSDFGVLQRCFSGAGTPVDPTCGS